MNPSEHVNQAFRSAQEMAAKANVPVNTAALLAALLDATQSVAVRVMSKIADVQAIRRDALVDAQTSVERAGNGGVSHQANNVLELAARFAADMGYNVVGTEHLMLALLHVKCAAQQICNNNGVSFDDFKQALFMELQGAQIGEQGPAVDSQTSGIPGEDLTELARQGHLKPVIGRDAEIRRIVRILARKDKNNPILLGEPGVGKTAVVEGLAQRIVEGNVPEVLKNKRIISLSVVALVAGTRFRGDFEARMQRLIEEAEKQPDIILFIDEIHTIMGAGAAGNAIDVANTIKPALTRGKLRIIGATTYDEYRKFMEKDGALKRRFQPVLINEPSQEETIKIIEQLKSIYEGFHGVDIPGESIRAAVKLSSRYIGDRLLPDKAIDLIDEAAAHVKIASVEMLPPAVAQLRQRLAEIEREKREAATAEDYERAAELKEEQERLTEQLQSAQQQYRPQVSVEDIALVMSEATGIPVQRIQGNEISALLNLDKRMKQQVIGQDHAVDVVADAIRRARTGLGDPNRPIGSFIFLGPSGVGKTELAKVLAKEMFGSADAMIRIDMSEYGERHSVSRLIGAPPGYVGHTEGGQLTEAVRRRPYAVVLLDEMEKAHPDVWNVLLQVLDEGQLTDGLGNKVNFRNTVVILTSNIGSNQFTKKSRAMGFGRSDEDQDVAESVKEHLKRMVRPEILNRIDEIVVFNQLTEEDLNQIFDLQMQTVHERLREKGVTLHLTPSVRKKIIKEGYSEVYGARPLRRAIEKTLLNNLSRAMLQGKVQEGAKVEVSLRNGSLVFSVTPAEEPAPVETV